MIQWSWRLASVEQHYGQQISYTGLYPCRTVNVDKCVILPPKPNKRTAGIATRYGLDGQWIESRPQGPPSLLHNGYRIFPGVKTAGTWCRPTISSEWVRAVRSTSVLSQHRHVVGLKYGARCGWLCWLAVYLPSFHSCVATCLSVGYCPLRKVFVSDSLAQFQYTHLNREKYLESSANVQRQPICYAAISMYWVSKLHLTNRS